MKKIEKSIELGGRKLTLTQGLVAQQADGAVMVTYGETVVLATVVASPLKQDLGYFPLMVEYKERLYAGGIIKGSRWVKRDGRPTDDEILTARLVDRSIRPLFPKEYKMDVQVIITVLSVDKENSPDVAAATAVYSALASSSIPWKGPTAMIKVGYKEKKYITNPTVSEQDDSKMELLVTTTKDAIVMIEAGSNQVSEKEMLGGIAHALKESKKLIALIDEFSKAAGNKKEVVKKSKPDTNIQKQVKKLAGDNLPKVIKKSATAERGSRTEFSELKNAVRAQFEGEEIDKAMGYLDEMYKAHVRKAVLSGKRIDGRKSDELRKLSAMTGVLPRTHGSAIFQRGQTQVLNATTLGPSSLEQTIETAEGEETKRYIHHYSMPPFSVGETGRVGFPSRRDIGHGALAERALMPVVPSKADFPYTILTVSEVLSSNGSTSMASVCASTLSLMDAGVPISSPVAGIAMGLIIESDKKYEILTDIVGVEDSNGDMDFKVAGTLAGITALQLDVKTLNLTLPILEKAMMQALGARKEILKVMVKEIDKPRDKVSTHAPKIKVIKIPTDKIGDVIGPGGKIIKAIIADTGAQVDVEDDGSVSISAIKEESVKSAQERIEALTKDPQAGEIYEGEVKRIQPFGAFVEILPGKDGLVHISDMREEYVNDPNDVVKIGGKVKVRVIKIDDLGRINLSMVMDPAHDKKKEDRKRNNRRGGDNRRGGGRRYERRNYSGGNRKKGSNPSGPHFPASRLVEPNKKRYSG